MTAQEIFEIILRMTSVDIANFNGETQLDYEVWQQFEGSGLLTGEYDNIVLEAENWDDNFMNDVNSLGDVAGIKPKKRSGDPTPE